jgi:hypothetical protein
MVAAIAASLICPEGLSCPWVFVAPLALLLGVGGGSLLPVIVAWLLFVALTAWSLWAKKRVAFSVRYGILCALLLLNVVGCYQLSRFRGPM